MVICACKEIITYRSMVTDHRVTCNYGKLLCPLGCKTLIRVHASSLTLMNAYNACQHYEVCPEAIISCNTCNLQIKRKYQAFLGTHKLDCDTLRCLKCNQRIHKSEIEYHDCDTP